VLRAVVVDREVEGLFVDRPRRIVRGIVFVVSAVALAFPALIGVAAYFVIRSGPPQRAASIARWAAAAGTAPSLVVGGWESEPIPLRARARWIEWR
jgi:hypothetical protein